MFSQASFTRCLRPLAAKSHYAWLLLQPINTDWLDISHVPFYWFQSLNYRKKGWNIKVIKLGFSGALKMANEERELSVSAQCKLGGWDSLRLNSNNQLNQLRDLTRRHFILPHFHPLQLGLKGVREEGKKEGGGGAGQRGVLLLSHIQCFCVYHRHEKQINNPGFFSPYRISMLLRRCGRYTGNETIYRHGWVSSNLRRRCK